MDTATAGSSAGVVVCPPTAGWPTSCSVKQSRARGRTTVERWAMPHFGGRTRSPGMIARYSSQMQGTTASWASRLASRWHPSASVSRALWCPTSSRTGPQGPHRLCFPYAVVNDEQRVIVADTSANRVLIWHDIPREGAGVEADTVLAQPGLDANGKNGWIAVADYSLCWPYGLSLAGDTLAIAGSGNNRVVFWRIG